MSHRQKKSDVILIGAGIMSATLGTMLKELAPDWEITVFERRGKAGEESSNEWNNAGTGHASLCELNYTVEKADGSIDIGKAVQGQRRIPAFPAVLVLSGRRRGDPKSARVHHAVPHMSMVQGEQDVAFLKKRYRSDDRANPLFEGMEFSDDPGTS